MVGHHHTVQIPGSLQQEENKPMVLLQRRDTTGVCGTCFESCQPAWQPMTAEFVPNLRNLQYASADHSLILNLKYFNYIFNEIIFNYKCSLKQEAATPWLFDGTLRSAAIFIALIASEFLTKC